LDDTKPEPYKAFLPFSVPACQKSTIFAPFFDGATSIPNSCHRCHQHFYAQYDRHDVHSILQAKIRCSELKMLDESIK
jgi:hypothetical protein